MEDPIYNAAIPVGGNQSSYSFFAFSRNGLQANQSFILSLVFTDEESPALPFDISGATATLYVSGYKVTDFPVATLGAGVLTDSGSGTVDTVTFTVVKDQIPDDLGALPLTKTGNAVFYCILEDADTKLQFYQAVNVLDENFALTGDNSVSENVILAGGNDLGTVIDTSLNTPPGSPDFLDAYIVGPAGTGLWAGADNNLAVWNGADWIFRLPETGNFVYDVAAESTYTYDGDSWEPFTPADGSITQAKLAPGFKLPDANVDNLQLADMAQDTIKGRASAGAGVPEDLSSGQVRSMLSVDQIDNTSDADKPVSTAQQTALDLKLDATATAADSSKINGIPVNNTDISNGRVLAYNSTGLELEYVDQSGGGGGGGVSLPFIFSTDVTATDPTSGGIKANSATIGAITEIYISYTSNNNVDATLRINSLINNGFYIQQLDTDANFIEASVTTVTDNTGWATLAVTLQSTGSLPANSAVIGVDFNFYSSAGISVPSVHNRTGNVVSAPGDYAASQITNDSSQPGAYVSDVLDTLGSGTMLSATYDPAGIAEQLVGLDATQALTNKSINGYTPTVLGSASLFVNGQGNLALPPGASGGEANTGDNVGGGTGEIYRGNTSTVLDFKTLVGGTNVNLTNGADTVTINSTGITTIAAATDTNFSGLATGDILYYDGSDFVNLGVGTVGQVLKSTGTIPAWQADSGGGGGFPTGKISPTVTASTVIDWTQGDTFDLGTLTENVTVSFTGELQGQTIDIIWTSASGYDVTFPGTVTALSGGTTTVDSYNAVYLNAIDGSTEQHGSFSTDVASASPDLTAVNAWTGQQYFAEDALTSGTNIAWDLDTQQTATLTLATNGTLDNPTNLKAGATYILTITQDGTGSRTLAYGSAYKWAGGTAPTLSTAIGAVDIITFKSDGTNMYGVFSGDFS